MIESISNKQVKHVAALNSRGKLRKEEGLYVAEGLRMCKEYRPEDLEMLYVTPAFEMENREWLSAFSYEMVSEEVMRVMADTRTPQGVLAVARQKKMTLEQLLESSRDGGLFMVLEQLQDPGNLGTILRAGEGAGVTGLIMSSDTADIYNPKVIRSTMGSILRVPFAYTENLALACHLMKQKGIRLFAAHLKGSVSYDSENYCGSTAFLIGNEARGLTDELAEAADARIRIPMAGQVESLNAAVAASVLMFEAARQRRGQAAAVRRV